LITSTENYENNSYLVNNRVTYRVVIAFFIFLANFLANFLGTFAFVSYFPKKRKILYE